MKRWIVLAVVCVLCLGCVLDPNGSFQITGIQGGGLNVQWALIVGGG